MANKLNSMRILESNQVAYEVLTYDPAIHDASEVGHALGVPPTQVFKTLVVERAAGKPVLVMIPADRHLELKKFAAAIGEKKVSMATQANAEALTGLKVGGIGALALTAKRWNVYLDQSASAYTHICVSAGQRGINLRVPVADLVRILQANIVNASTDQAQP